MIRDLGKETTLNLASPFQYHISIPEIPFNSCLLSFELLLGFFSIY
jgi:hypothetical protein